MANEKLGTSMVIGLEVALAVIISVLVFFRTIFSWLGFVMGDTIVIILVLSQLVVTIASVGLGCGHGPADIAKTVGHLVSAIAMAFYSTVYLYSILMWVEFIAFFFALVLALYNSRACTKLTRQG
jgi:hypothetical protein